MCHKALPNAETDYKETVGGDNKSYSLKKKSKQKFDNLYLIAKTLVDTMGGLEIQTNFSCRDISMREDDLEYPAEKPSTGKNADGKPPRIPGRKSHRNKAYQSSRCHSEDRDHVGLH